MSVVYIPWTENVMYFLCSRCLARTTVLLSYSLSSHWLPQTAKGSHF